MKTPSYPRMHISLYVSDLQKTKSFYSLFFDQEPSKEKEGYMKYELDNPSLVISFLENKERVNPIFGHLGFQLESKEELNRSIERINKAQLESRQEEGTACCYAIQDKIWVTDPDGVQWEVYYFHQDVEFNDPHYKSEQSEQCCLPPVKEKLNLSEIKAVSCC